METIEKTVLPEPRTLTIEEERRMRLIEELERLSEASAWHWDYTIISNAAEQPGEGFCGTAGCAIGLALFSRQFPEFTPKAFYECEVDIGTYFGMTWAEVRDIFFGGRCNLGNMTLTYGVRMGGVTSAMVAAELRKITPRKQD